MTREEVLANIGGVCWPFEWYYAVRVEGRLPRNPDIACRIVRLTKAGLAIVETDGCRMWFAPGMLAHGEGWAERCSGNRGFAAGYRLHWPSFWWRRRYLAGWVGGVVRALRAPGYWRHRAKQRRQLQAWVAEMDRERARRAAVISKGGES